MAQRGVAIPNLRERLFDAASQVLARDGALGLTGRKVASEAGFSSGLLYRHFADFDAFLAAFTVYRFGQSAEALSELPARAGQGTVAGNVTAAATPLLVPETLAVANLVAARPQLFGLIRQAALGGDGPHFDLVAAIRSYLDQEKRLGRVRESADTDAVAVAIVGTVHQILLINPTPDDDPHAQLARVVDALVSGIAVPATEAS